MNLLLNQSKNILQNLNSSILLYNLQPKKTTFPIKKQIFKTKIKINTILKTKTIIKTKTKTKASTKIKIEIKVITLINIVDKTP